MSTTRKQELVFQGACALLGPKLFLNVYRNLDPINPGEFEKSVDRDMDDAIALSHVILSRVQSQIDIPPAVIRSKFDLSTEEQKEEDTKVQVMQDKLDKVSKSNNPLER